MNPLCAASATSLARMIRERDVSSLEVVDAYLARIDDVNPKLNAVVQIAPDARDRARDADAALARGDEVGPLHGVPFTVKDWIEAEGLICAAGFAERAQFVPKRDATVVARMRAAGAILLGKTNVTDGAPVYPRPNNPYDLARSPGGSSSGEAAIIAAGGSPLGLGSDSGGSIRLPAAWCGVAGLRPTSGLVPNTGHFPRIGAMHDPRTAIGPIARRRRRSRARAASHRRRRRPRSGRRAHAARRAVVRGRRARCASAGTPACRAPRRRPPRPQPYMRR